MKTAIVILLSLAVTSIIGTVIPQNKNPTEYLQAFGEFLYRLFDVFDFFDMYGSWWFQLLIILLTINIVICSIDRLSSTWKIIFVKVPSFKLSRFKSISFRKKFSDSRSPGELQGIYERAVSKGFGYVRVEQADRGYCIFAEKWRWTRLGVYIVHLSVVLLLFGSLIGSIFGFDGYVNIEEGQNVDMVRVRNSNEPQKLGFLIQCDDFNVSYYESGTPREYRSSLTIIEQDKSILNKNITVNDPLRYKGINIFQSSFGEVPPNKITIQIINNLSGMSYSEKVTIGKPFDLPEDMGKLEIKGSTDSTNFKGVDLREAFVGVFEPKNWKPVEIILPLRYPDFDKMRKGDQVFSVSGYDKIYYTGLQVTKDPGVWIVYSGFILMILGCIVTFFMSHQRICVEVTKSGEKTEINVSGYANKNKLGIENKVSGVAKRLMKLD
jgi:cytochrome c biogenesis protein